MKLTKRISLLMAIVMIVTAVMSVMPTMVIAAEPAAVANQVSIYAADADGKITGIYEPTGSLPTFMDDIKRAQLDCDISLFSNK